MPERRGRPTEEKRDNCPTLNGKSKADNCPQWSDEQSGQNVHSANGDRKSNGQNVPLIDTAEKIAEQSGVAERETNQPKPTLCVAHQRTIGRQDGSEYLGK